MVTISNFLCLRAAVEAQADGFLYLFLGSAHSLQEEGRLVQDGCQCHFQVSHFRQEVAAMVVLYLELYQLILLFQEVG